jgi:four helix bundle protein
MSIGSCDEVRVWIEFAKDLSYITEEERMYYDKKYVEIGKMLRGIQKHYESKS